MLRRQGLADADCSDLEELDEEQLRVLRDDFGLRLRGHDCFTESSAHIAHTGEASQ